MYVPRSDSRFSLSSADSSASFYSAMEPQHVDPDHVDSHHVDSHHVDHVDAGDHVAAQHVFHHEARVPVNGDVIVLEDTDTNIYYRVHSQRRKGFLCFGSKHKKHQSKEIKRLKSEARKQQCYQTFFTFIYILLAILAVVFTYSLILDLVHSMNNPVRSIQYKKVRTYDPAPGIAIYPGGAELLACGHYFNNIVTSKVRLSQLDLVNRNCTYINMTYDDPILPDMKRTALMFRGPTQPNDGKEAVFFHFQLEDETRDFFTVSYYLFTDWDAFNRSSPSERLERTVQFHQFKPTYALSAGLRMWIKLIMKTTHEYDQRTTDFRIEYSVVQLHDKRPPEEKNKKHLFFIFFEWKDDMVEESLFLTTTTPWSVGAALCGVLLTLHKGYQLAQDSYRRMQKSKERQATFKQTLKMHERRQNGSNVTPSKSGSTPRRAPSTVTTPKRRGSF